LINVGIIGAGYVAKFHMDAYSRAGANVIAVADANTTRASELAQSAGSEAFSDYRDLLARDDIEAVSICLPNHLHFRATRDALKAGKHVLCEKPITTTLEDAQELAALARRSESVLQVAYMKRYIPAFIAARESLSEIGSPLSATVKVFHYFPEKSWDDVEAKWGLRRASAGGGPLVHAGSHIIDILHWWFGPIISVRAKVRMKKGLDVDDYSAATMITESGVTVFFECGWLPLSHIGRLGDGWDERIEVTGDCGRVELFTTWWDRPSLSPLLRVYCEGMPSREFHFESTDAFTSEITAFLNAVKNGEDVTPNAEDGLHVQEVLEAMYVSSERNDTIDIEELRGVNV